jgi:hypothetical protein
MTSRDHRIAVPAQGAHTLEGARERVVHALGVHFANDDLTLDELERRLSLAFQATTPAALEPLLADLPSLSANPLPVARAPVAPGGVGVPERGVLVAVMGANVRKGSWLVPRYLKVITLMGGVELDLRQARLAPGVTEIEVLAVMGGVEIIVPPGVRVELMGVAIMGGFETSGVDERALDPGQPILRLTGLAFMAGVEAKLKRPSSKALAKFDATVRALRGRSDDSPGAR